MKSRSFTDFGAFEASVRNASHRMFLHNPGRRLWKITHADLPRIHLQVGLEGGGNITEGQARSDGYLVFHPLSNARAHAANGVALDEKSFAILEPECDFCVRCDTQHDWCTIFVPTLRFADAGDEHAAKTEKMTCRVSHANLRAASQFRRLVTQVMTTAAKHPNFESSPAAAHVEEELLDIASAVAGRPLEREHHQEGQPLLPSYEIARRCKPLLEELDAQPIRVDELAAAVDVSQRTLRRAFKEYYGIGPVRFLQLRQLHQVHRAMKASDPEETTVTDVLFAHAVSELGRFASRYRAMFGELPSETLRTKRW